MDRHISLCGASSFSHVENFGDHLMKDIFVAWIKEQDSDATVDLLRYGGMVRGGKRWRDALASSTSLVYLGGGYFGEQTYPKAQRARAVGMHLAWGTRNNRMYCGPFRLARKRGIPHAVFGVEYGPITHPGYRRNSVHLLSYANVVTLRNEESKAFANIYGVVRDIQVAPDVVLAVSRSKLDDWVPGGARVRLRPERVHIALHIHKVSAFASHEHLKRLIGYLVSGLDGDAALHYIHDQHANGVPKTRAVLAEASLHQTYPNITMHPYSSHWRLVELLANFDLVITTKLHVGILARALDIPVLSFPSHVKSQRFYKHIGELWRCMSPASTWDEIRASADRVLLEIRKGEAPLSPSARAAALLHKRLLREFLEGQ